MKKPPSVMKLKLARLAACINDESWDDAIEHLGHLLEHCCGKRMRSSESPKDVSTRTLTEACNEVLRRWSFDNNQHPTHTWHDMQDCRQMILTALAKVKVS